MLRHRLLEQYISGAVQVVYSSVMSVVICDCWSAASLQTSPHFRVHTIGTKACELGS